MHLCVSIAVVEVQSNGEKHKLVHSPNKKLSPTYKDRLVGTVPWAMFTRVNPRCSLYSVFIDLIKYRKVLPYKQKIIYFVPVG